MADIDVVPKRRTSVWLWIIAAIVIALIVMAMLGMFSGGAANRVGELITSPLNPLLTIPPVAV